MKVLRFSYSGKNTVCALKDMDEEHVKGEVALKLTLVKRKGRKGKENNFTWAKKSADTVHRAFRRSRPIYSLENIHINAFPKNLILQTNEPFSQNQL